MQIELGAAGREGKAPGGDGKQTPMDPIARDSQSGSGKLGAIIRVIATGHLDLIGWWVPGMRAWSRGPHWELGSGAWQWWQARPPFLGMIGCGA